MSFKFFCNQCQGFPSDAKRKYWVSSCMHIFCEMCFTDKDFCKLCDKPVRTIPINRELPTDVRVFIEPHSAENMVTTLERVWNYQTGQNVMFYGQNENRNRYNNMKEAIIGQQKATKQLDEEMRQETVIIEKLKSAYA